MRGTEKSWNEEMEKYSAEMIPGIWMRIRKACADKGTSVGSATTAIGMNPSAVYATLRDVDAGRPTKDFELYLIKALSDYLGTDMDWIIHGIEPSSDDGNCSTDRIMESLRTLSGGSMKSMMLALLPFLTKEEQEALYADFISRIH